MNVSMDGIIGTRLVKPELWVRNARNVRFQKLRLVLEMLRMTLCKYLN